MKEKKKGSGSALTAFVAFSIFCCLIYTVISQVMAVKTGASLDTLTTCFFALFGGEVISCALIKIFKLKERDGYDDGDDAPCDHERIDNAYN